MILEVAKTLMKNKDISVTDNILKNFGQPLDNNEISDLSDIVRKIIETGSVEEESTLISPNMKVIPMTMEEYVSYIIDDIFSLDDDDAAAIQENYLIKREEEEFYNDDGASVEVQTIPYEEKYTKTTKIPIFITSEDILKQEIIRFLQSTFKNFNSNKQFVINSVSQIIKTLVGSFRRYIVESTDYIEADAQKYAYKKADEIINQFCIDNKVERKEVINDELFYPVTMLLDLRDSYTKEEVHRILSFLYKKEYTLADDIEHKDSETVFEIKIDDLLSQVLNLRKYQYKLWHSEICAPSAAYQEYLNQVKAYEDTYNSFFDTYIKPSIKPIKSNHLENICSLTSTLVNLGAEVIHSNASDDTLDYESEEQTKILQELERKRIRNLLNHGAKTVVVGNKTISIPYKLWGFTPSVVAPEEIVTFKIEPYFTWEIKPDLTEEETTEYDKLLLEKAKMTYRLRKERENYFKILQTEKKAKEQQQKETISAYNRTHNKTLAQLNEDIREREINKYGHELTKEERTLIYNADDLDTQEKINRKKIEFARLQKIFSEIGESVPDLEIKKSVNMILFGQETVPYRDFPGYSTPVQRMTSEELYESRDLTAYFESNFVVDEEDLDEELNEECMD